jgi:hypothetical protein
MRQIRVSLVGLILFIAASQAAIAQELGELTVQPVPEDQRVTYIVRNSGESILVVHSTIPHLSFEGNLGIIRVDNPDPGEYRLHLPSGTNIITFKAENYLPVKERFYIPAKSFEEVKVSVKRKPIELRSENRPEIILRYTPAMPDEKLLGSIDDKVMHLNFSGGSIKLKPTPGEHIIRLNNSGRVWEKTYDLKEGDKVDEVVEFPATPTEIAAVPEPGGLYITSTPPGAAIYMNEVEQGLTPLTLENVQPGRYEFDIIRPLYLSEQFAVDVKPLDYTTHHIELTPNFGRLHIETDPTGAAVYINDEERGFTPFELSQVETGSYNLKLVKSRYHDAGEVLEVAAGDTILRNIQLKPKFGRLVITSEPSGAALSLDGKAIGSTPVDVDTVLSGSHLLRLALEHYHDLDDLVLIKDGEVFTQHYNLPGNFGLLTVLSDPPEAMVTMEGVQHLEAVTPFENMKVPPGSYQVKVEKDGYEPQTATIMLALGTEERLEPKLVRMTGILKVSSRPQGATILLNGENFGKTPAILKEVPTGAYEIRIDKSGYDLLVDSLAITNRQITNQDVELSTEGTSVWLKKRNKARLFSLIVPGGGQFASPRQAWRGGLYAATVATFIYLAVEAHGDQEDYRNTYETERETYDALQNTDEISPTFNSMNQAYGNMQDAEDNWQMFTYLAVGVYAWQVADTWLWGGGPRPTMKTIFGEADLSPHCYITPGEDHPVLGVQLRIGGGK